MAEHVNSCRKCQWLKKVVVKEKRGTIDKNGATTDGMIKHRIYHCQHPVHSTVLGVDWPNRDPADLGHCRDHKPKRQRKTAKASPKQPPPMQPGWCEACGCRPASPGRTKCLVCISGDEARALNTAGNFTALTEKTDGR